MIPPLSVEGLSYTFAGRDEPTLREASFAISPGSWTLVAGQTGSGKTTLLRALAGLIPRHAAGEMQGRVLWFGRDLRDAPAAELAGAVGLVLQSPDDQLCATTVEAEAAFGLENLGLPAEEIAARVAEALSRMALAGLGERRTAQLSGGQKQRLLLVSILAMRPGILLLDEPLSQLDPQAALDFLALLDGLRRDGLTIVLAEHRLDDVVRYADRLLVMDAGRVAADVPLDGADWDVALAASGIEPPELTRAARRLGLGPLRTVEQALAALPPEVSADDWSAADGDSLSQANELRRFAQVASDEEALLVVENLALRHTGREAPLWRDASFALKAGERVALVGPNGAGKSTLLAVLAGLLPAGEGLVSLPSHASRAGMPIGLVPQNPDLTLFCATVGRELAYGPRQMGLPAEEIDHRTRAAAAALSLDELWDEPPLAQSQGQRLRIALAAMLTLRPGVLLLDEPTTGQDWGQVAAIMGSLSKLVRTGDETAALLFATHDVRAVARWATRVLVLAEGRLLADCTPEELLQDDRLLAAARLHRPPWHEVRQAIALGATAASAVLSPGATAVSAVRGSPSTCGADAGSAGASPSRDATASGSPGPCGPMNDPLPSNNSAGTRPAATVRADWSAAFADARGRPWLAAADPRLKLAALVWLSVLSVLVDSLPALVGLLAVGAVAAGGLRMRPRGWLAVLGVLAAVAWGTVLSQSIFYAEAPRTLLVALVPEWQVGDWTFPGVRLYREGAVHGLAQSLRTLSVMLLGLAVCLSTSPERLLAALVRCRVPVAVAFIAVTALRFLPTLLGEWAMVRAARRLRGYRFPWKRPLQWFFAVPRAIFSAAGGLFPVLSGALRRAETLAASVSSRGFDPAARRTHYPPLRMRPAERMLLAGLFLTAAAVVTAKSLFWLYLADAYYHPALRPLYQAVRDWL